MSRVIDIVQFRLREGVGEEDFRCASVDMEAGFATKQPGFLRRNLAQGNDGTWVDVVYWEDLESSRSAAESAMHSDACTPFFAMIDDESIVLNHYEIV